MLKGLSASAVAVCYKLLLFCHILFHILVHFETTVFPTMKQVSDETFCVNNNSIMLTVQKFLYVKIRAFVSQS